MTTPPAQPKIYHITHVGNLPDIVAGGRLAPDAEMVARGGPAQTIGMSGIKRRRIERIEVACHPGTKVGDYVPFYFCPRSVMLYVIYCANHPDLAYRGGQEPILHLVADMHGVIRWAKASGVRWAFSLSNAGAYIAEFRAREEELSEIDWNAVAAADFRQPDIKERKQAEFLVHGGFPFRLVERIGARSPAIRDRAVQALAGIGHAPAVELHPEWYF